MYRFIFICLVLIIAGCAHDNSQMVDEEDRIALTVQFPDDSLVDQIKSYRLSVTALDIVEPIGKSSNIMPSSGSTDTILACAPDGADRVFTIYFSNAQGCVIFWGSGVVNVSEDENVSLTISVSQAAARSATRVKILRDNLPWNSNALDIILSDIGLSLGNDDDQYQIVSSDAFDTISLFAGEDLVIIANDQGQNFYDKYSESKVKIESFIAEGGTILWEACDLGWAGGSIDLAALELPGGVEIIAGYEDENYITNSLYNITTGLDSILIGSYASHEGFINFPDEALVYTRDSRGLPTLVSFSNGLGWVIITGQPLEYNYQANDVSSPSALLPRIISHVLGYDLNR